MFPTGLMLVLIPKQEFASFQCTTRKVLKPDIAWSFLFFFSLPFWNFSFLFPSNVSSPICVIVGVGEAVIVGMGEGVIVGVGEAVGGAVSADVSVRVDMWINGGMVAV